MNISKEHLSQRVFPNLFKLVKITITSPALQFSHFWEVIFCNAYFNTYLRLTMAQNRFSGLGVLNKETYIVVHLEDILNDLGKTERIIQLL